MKKIVTILLVVIAIVSNTAVCFANCDREVTVNGKKQACNAPIAWVTSGQSIEKSATHKYGGFLGFFQGTCEYKYRDVYQHYQCTKKHVQDMNTIRNEYAHSSCGQ